MQMSFLLIILAYLLPGSLLGQCFNCKLLRLACFIIYLNKEFVRLAYGREQLGRKAVFRCPLLSGNLWSSFFDVSFTCGDHDVPQKYPLQVSIFCMGSSHVDCALLRESCRLCSRKTWFQQPLSAKTPKERKLHPRTGHWNRAHGIYPNRLYVHSHVHPVVTWAWTDMYHSPWLLLLNWLWPEALWSSLFLSSHSIPIQAQDRQIIWLDEVTLNICLPVSFAIAAERAVYSKGFLFCNHCKHLLHSEIWKGDYVNLLFRRSIAINCLRSHCHLLSSILQHHLVSCQLK